MKIIPLCACGCGDFITSKDKRGRPTRFLMGHRTKRPLKDRFFEKVKRTSGCWIWMASLDHQGYGQFAITTLSGSGNYKPYKAHRIAWELRYGPIKNGLHVCHKCDNRKCVNPDHLFLGNIQDNMNDKLLKGRQPRGEKCYNSKLNELNVLEIRKLYATKTITMKKIGEKFGVSMSSIRQLLSGRSWYHVE